MQSDEPGGERGTGTGVEQTNSVQPSTDNLSHHFPSAGRGPWTDISEKDWNDWRWQLRNRITTRAIFKQSLPQMTKEERLGVQLAGHHLAMAITPYFFNLIDVNDPNCPIRRQVIPRIEETTTA